jgi:predicted tellurium resistance membrane protein TerC
MLIGLLLSVGIIFGFSSLITRAIARFPYIVYAGAFLLAATAAGMMWPALWAAFSGGVVATAGARLGLAYAARYTFTAVIVVMCLSSPRWWPTTP